MKLTEIGRILTQGLNMALDINGETTYTNSFEVRMSNEGFYFIPRLPAGYVIDDDLYQKIFVIASFLLFPNFTVLKQNSAYVVPLDTDDIHVQRALFFPWFKGISERLVIPSLEEFSQSNLGNKIPVMQNLALDLDKVTSIAIAGNSGSGKSYLLTYFLEMLSTMSQLVICDPKFDTPSRWAKLKGIETIHPQQNRSKSDFVTTVNEKLSEIVELIQTRQVMLFENPNQGFEHLTMVIDETLALTEGVNKQIKESFLSLLSTVALLGRATRCHLVLVSQRFDFNAVPVSVREQMNVVIQVGNINSKTVKFLFPDLDPEGIVIPIGKGTGLIQVIDSEHPYQVLPLLTPTYYTEKGIL